MKRFMVLIVLSLSVVFAQPEVIKIDDKIFDRTKKYFWPGLANGGVFIGDGKIYIPDQNRVLVQSRTNPQDKTYLNIHLGGKDRLRIYEICVTDQKYYLTVFLDDGRFYIASKTKLGLKDGVLVPKHGSCDRMIETGNGNILATGSYRPAYGVYLDLYDDESGSGQTELSKRMFDSFYREQIAFTLAFYDKDLVLIDSANAIDRVGENAEYFDYMFLGHPVDVTQSGEVFYIDNDQGYIVERYSEKTKMIKSTHVKHNKFKPIPSVMNDDVRKTLHGNENSYSEAYALYIKNDKIITSFFQSPKLGDSPKPPYYYDILTLEGKHLFSGTIQYPIICEDEAEKVFLFVRVPGGWFEDDVLYLVGVTLEDIMAGKAKKSYIEAAIAKDEAGD